MRARLSARAFCIESPPFSASRAAACRGPRLCPLAGEYLLKELVEVAQGQSHGVRPCAGPGAHPSEWLCTDPSQSAVLRIALTGRPVIQQTARRCKTQRQADVVVAVAAKPVPTMVTETPKVKEVKQSGASKHDLTPEVATDLCKCFPLTIRFLAGLE